MKIRPHVRAALAARLANEPIFDVGEPDIVGPLIGAGRDVMRAVIVAAIDQDAANTGFAHLAKRDLLRTLHHRDLCRLGFSPYCAKCQT